MVAPSYLHARKCYFGGLIAWNQRYDHFGLLELNSGVAYVGKVSYIVL